jgi:hypothetical protein
MLLGFAFHIAGMLGNAALAPYVREDDAGLGALTERT